MGLPVRWTAAPANSSGTGPAHSALDAMASPEGQAGAADVPNYYHDDPLFMFFEK
jgi:hypothetical protein